MSKVSDSIYQGFIRVACAAPRVAVADVDFNTSSVISLMKTAAGQDADIVVFPELCLTAYTCADLFHSSLLLARAEEALARVAAESTKYPDSVFTVGLPVLNNGALYNCAAIVANGNISAIVPKTYLPDYNEFYERRWFETGAQTTGSVHICGQNVPFGSDIIVNVKGINVGVEICEDLWVPSSPGTAMALAGAQLILNLSASDDIIGKYNYLRELVAQQSARCLCAYAYASAGFGESSTDLVFDAKLFIAENGRMLAHNNRWTRGEQLICADIDVEALARDRMHLNSFARCASLNKKQFRIVDTTTAPLPSRSDILRSVDPHPFVPAANADLNTRCEEIIGIQSAALAKRLDATHTKTLVIGISGGLDSTLALLVAVRAFDSLGIPRKGIVGVTMPGFGTTGRTHSNALNLMEQLGVESMEIPIADAVKLHFRDIGHDLNTTDVTYENSQARERTQILMDLANKLGGMVLGTGDLSELALGWATYNGDHMSMYAVNAGVPKTLVKHLVSYFATEIFDGNSRATLLDIIDTPISPELTPASADGTIAQKTEDLVGPYELHDFFLYYLLRYGFGPKRIFALALKAFGQKYPKPTVIKWLRTFFRRFFNQQFKRSCLPDGPKVGSVCLSPRGDWRMPSDASASIWLKECDELN